MAASAEPDFFNLAAWLMASAPHPAWRDGSNAVVYAEKAVAATRRANANYLDTLAAAYAEIGQFDKAVAIQQEATSLVTDVRKKADFNERLSLYQAGLPFYNDRELASLALGLLQAGKFAEAEPVLRKWVTMREKIMPTDWLTFNARSALGGSLLGQKKYAEAEPLLLAGYEGMKQRDDKIPADARPLRLKQALQRLMQLYEATSRPDQAAEWKQKLAEFDKAQE